MNKVVIRTMVGVQEAFKRSQELLNNEANWVQQITSLVEMSKDMKLTRFKQNIFNITGAHKFISGESNLEEMFSQCKTVIDVSQSYTHLVRKVSRLSVMALLNFNKFLSVIIKIFSEIMTNGFCPIKDLDDNNSKTSNEFKSSEEESGLGQGEGSKDVSDQIENEDMLDGAYQNQEDANDPEEQDNKEEDNGIEMSENFESKMQDKENKEDEGDDDKNEDESKELEDEKGEVDESDGIDKEMWDEDDNEPDNNDLEEGDEGKSSEEKLEELSAKEDNQKSDEKRQRQEEKTEENQEFDDNQTDAQHGEDNQFPEPEAFDLPENMDLDTAENEEKFEEPESNDPEVMPDFEKEETIHESDSDDEQDKGNPDIDALGDDTPDDNFPDDPTDLQPTEEEQEEEKMDIDDKKVQTDDNEGGMDVDENSEKSVEANNELEKDQDNKSGSDGLNSDDRDSESKDSFGVKSKEEKAEDQAGAGSQTKNDKMLSEETQNAEKLDIVEGVATEENMEGEASIFQHVSSEQEKDRTAIDKAKDEERNDKVIPDNIKEDMEKDSDARPPEMKEEHAEKKDVFNDKRPKQNSKKPENEGEDNETIETEGEFVQTFGVSRGADSIISQSGPSDVFRDPAAAMPEVSMSLDAIQLSDNTQNDNPVVTQLSHQLCEQLRLILEPTKASKLQGDFKTGKRLNMRKIIPYIASQFKKDKIWLRRVKPNKREFQIVVALDDSSSMADNKSREMALSSLSTISSALTLLEVGQIGVLRFGKSAEVVHSLGSPWSQSAGHRIQNQFSFEQKETSLISLLNLSTQLFMSSSSSASRNLSVSQLLVIVSDGRGVFHEGKEKVIQAVRRARQAGYFCLFLIVENPEAKDSVLDIRLPIFSGGKCSIDSYMEHFPFSHYIVLRDVSTLPRTLSDALRQWFELVMS